MLQDEHFFSVRDWSRNLQPHATYAANGHGWSWSYYREGAGRVILRYSLKTNTLLIQTRIPDYGRGPIDEVVINDRHFETGMEAEAIEYMRELLEIRVQIADQFPLVRAYCLGRQETPGFLKERRYSWTWRTWLMARSKELVVHYNAYLDLLLVEEEVYLGFRNYQLSSREVFRPEEENEAVALIRSMR